MIRDSHFSRSVNSYERRSAPYFTSQRNSVSGTVYTKPKFDKSSKVWNGCCTSHLPTMETTDTKRTVKLATNHTSLHKHCLVLVLLSRYQNLITLVRYDKSVTRLKVYPLNYQHTSYPAWTPSICWKIISSINRLFILIKKCKTYNSPDYAFQ